MKKKNVIVYISIIFMLLTVAISIVSSKEANQDKESPLYEFRSNNAINKEENKDILAKFVDNGNFFVELKDFSNNNSLLNNEEPLWETVNACFTGRPIICIIKFIFTLDNLPLCLTVMPWC